MVSRRGLSFDGKLFFLYDREAITSEADPPENAIIYFYPASATIESRISICGQLIGMSNFLSTVLDFAPVMINLKTEKVALYQSGKYTLALGGSISEPETLLMRQLQTLFDVFVFYHGSLDTVRMLSKDHTSFLTNMSIIWDCYIHFIRHYGDTLPAVFNPLPFLKAPKNSSQRCFLKASHILQACQRRHHILGGCILHQKSVLCTQLETSITKRLLLLKPNQSHHPGKQVNTEIKLPFGVRFLDSFVTCCEYERLIKVLQKSPYHNSSISTEPHPQNDKSPRQHSTKKTALGCESAKEISKSQFTNPRSEKQQKVLKKHSVDKEKVHVATENMIITSQQSKSNKKNETESKISKTIDESITNGHQTNGNDVCQSCCTGNKVSSLDCSDDSYHDNIDSLVSSVNGDGVDNSMEPLGDEELTMDEIDISGLHIVNGSSRDINKRGIPQTEVIQICSELIDSLIDQVSNSNTLSKCEISVERDVGVLSNQESEVSKTISGGVECVCNNESSNCGPQGDEEEIIHMTNGLDTNEHNKLEDDCYCDGAKMDSDGQVFSTPPINLPGLLSHTNQANNPPNPLPQESVNSPVEEFHDTVEDFAGEEEMKFTPKTVDAFFHSYRDLKTNNLMSSSSKYSAYNINYPDDKKVEKSFFKDLVGTGKLNPAVVSEFLDQGSLSVQNDSSQEPPDTSRSEGNGRESGFSHSISSESPTPGCSGNTALGDSGLCLFHGSSESSLSQTDGVSNDPDLQQDLLSSSTSTVDLEMSTNTVKEEDDRQEEQAEYVDDFDERLYQIDGLVHINLYVQAHSNTVLILLADSSLSQDQETIKALWKTTLNELGELEVHLDQCSKTGAAYPEKLDDYGFVVYDSISSTTKGNLTEPVEQMEFKFCDTAKTVHEQFNNCTSLTAVTLRDSSAAVHCQRSLGQEVYFHKKGALKPFRGTPPVRDSAFSLERRVRKQLKKDHGVNVI